MQTIDEVALAGSKHKLKPFGASPTISSLTVGGQDARLITPSADQTPFEKGLSELLIPSRRHAPGIFAVMYADKDHIEAIAATIR